MHCFGLYCLVIYFILFCLLFSFILFYSLFSFVFFTYTHQTYSTQFYTFHTTHLSQTHNWTSITHLCFACIGLLMKYKYYKLIKYRTHTITHTPIVYSGCYRRNICRVVLSIFYFSYLFKYFNLLLSSDTSLNICHYIHNG